MKRLIVLLVVLSLLAIPGVQAQASSGPPSCSTAKSYTIKANDTLNGVAQKMNVPLDVLVKYNGIYKSSTQNQRRDFFVGQRFCMPPNAPAWDKKQPTWASWPAADFTGRIDSKNQLIITGWNFNYPASYFVKPSGMDKIRWNLKSRAFVASFKLPKKVTGTSLKFCLRNTYSDMEVCRYAYK
jgi:hypothetical protein